MDLWQDVRYAGRRLIEDRWFTLAAVAALSLGIGANTTVFTFVNAVLVRGLPFEAPDRIVAVFAENERGQQMGVSLQEAPNDPRTRSHVLIQERTLTCWSPPKSPGSTAMGERDSSPVPEKKSP